LTKKDDETPRNHYTDIDVSTIPPPRRVLKSDSENSGMTSGMMREPRIPEYAGRLDRGVGSIGHTPQSFYSDRSRSVVSREGGMVSTTSGRVSTTSERVERGRVSGIDGGRVSANSGRISGRSSANQRRGEGEETGGLQSYFSDGDMQGFSDVTRKILFGGK
jgi:hypothetical protein